MVHHRHAIDKQAGYTAYNNPTALTQTVETFRRRRAGLSATAGLSCLYRKLESLGYPSVKIRDPSLPRFHTMSACDRQTDRQTFRS